MKRQGETEANPRFQQLNTQLVAIQRVQAIKTQQAQQLQQQQQQHQQHQQQGQQPSGQQQQPQSRPMDTQSSPVLTVPQRPPENVQVNGISPLRYKTKFQEHSQG